MCLKWLLLARKVCGGGENSRVGAAQLVCRRTFALAEDEDDDDDENKSLAVNHTPPFAANDTPKLLSKRRRGTQIARLSLLDCLFGCLRGSSCSDNSHYYNYLERNKQAEAPPAAG